MKTMNNNVMGKVSAHETDDEFQEKRETITQSLEARYTIAMSEKDKYTACQVLSELMQYKAIEKDDERLKMLNSMKFDIESARDYRRKTDNTSKFIWCALPSRVKFTLTAGGHAGKRVEGNYEGDITIEKRAVPIVASEITLVGSIKRFAERLRELEQRNSLTHFNLGEDFAHDAEYGRYTIYELRAQSGQNFLRSHFGYVLVYHKSDDKIILEVFGDYDSLNVCYVATDEFTQELTDSFKSKLRDLNDDVSVQVNVVKTLKN